MPTLKIVVVSPVYIEGLEYQENLLVRYYEKYGHEVHVITSTFRSVFDYVNDLHDSSAKRDVSRLGNVTTYRLPYRLNLLNRIRVFEDITPILNDVGPDLIFVRDILPNLIECRRYVQRHAGCKMVLDYHGDYSNSANTWLSRTVLHGIVRRWFLSDARPYLSKIFAVTPGSAQFLHEVYGVKDEEMEILPLGADVDMGESVRASDARDELRREYGISPDAVVIFTGGKFDSLKRTDDLIKAFKRLPKGAAYLIIVGDASPENAAYKQYLVDLCEGRDDIRFTGWLNPQEVLRHFALADIAVFPASQSILWQQAIAMRLPLVVGEMSRYKQSITYLNGHNSVYVLNPSEILENALLRALRELIDNPALRAEMSAGAARTTKEMLDWNELIFRTLRFNARA